MNITPSLGITSSKRAALFLAAGMALASTSIGHAQTTVYQDTFSRTGMLNGTSATVTANAGDWVALGFTQGNTTSNAWNNGTDNPGPWILLRSQAIGGSGTRPLGGQTPTPV